MAKAYKLTIKNNLFDTISEFFKALLREHVVDALLVPQESPAQKSVIQSLVRKEEELKAANPFVPFLLMNSATLVSQLTVGNPKEKIGAVLRSCEVRAAIELSKLKQVNLDRLIIIGMDCLGTYESSIFREAIQKYNDTKTVTKEYLSKTVEAQAQVLPNKELRVACQACEYPNPENADIAINFLGCDINKEIFIQVSEKLNELKPEKFGLAPHDDISQWKKASQTCRDKRIKFRDRLFQEVLNQTKDIKNFMKELEHCRRCYNCRKECPICYCRECIFDSCTFEHDSAQYVTWAAKKGKIRMPTDTLLFHLTRMNHMVISCVGCGQCTSACPNNIPVAKFFKTIGSKVQELFKYTPGKSADEEIPQSTFKENEFPEVGK